MLYVISLAPSASPAVQVGALALVACIPYNHTVLVITVMTSLMVVTVLDGAHATLGARIRYLIHPASLKLETPPQ